MTTSEKSELTPEQREANRAAFRAGKPLPHPQPPRDPTFGATPEQRRAANRSAIKAGQEPKFPDEPDDPCVKQYRLDANAAAEKAGKPKPFPDESETAEAPDEPAKRRRH